jgi:hypothetical protein
VRWQVQGGSATIGQDVAAGSGELVWADAETADQTITVQLLDDDIAETDEQFSVLLSSVDGSELGSNASITITLRDDDSNTAPVVNAGEDRQVNAGQFVTLTSTAQDAEADTISYLWQQLSGTPVSLQGVNSASSSFIAPASAGALVFRVTATDTLGASSSDEVTISVLAAVQNTQPASSGGGSGALFVMALLLLLRWRRHGVYRLLCPVKITDDK